MPRQRSGPTTSDDPIRLVIVEPTALLGVGVREVLDREPDIEIVAQVRSPDEAIRIVDAAAPDVVLVDVPLPELSSSDATRRLRAHAPDSALVMFGAEGDDASLVGAMEVGADAVVGNHAEPAELVATIRRVADGEDPLKDELIGRPDLVERIVDGVREAILTERRPANPLTPRESEVLELVARGRHNREIAEALGLSEQTVKNHLSSILHRFGVPNRRAAITYAVRHGWISLQESPR
jgi:DNA-binding NarL/FixJ family response regulator